MTDTAVLEIALQTMMVALKLSAPILVTSLVDRLRDLAVPVDDADPGVHARFVPKADRRRRRAARLAATGCCTR